MSLPETKIQSRKVKILLYDIETMAELGWYWPPRYDTNIMHVEHFEHLLSVAWKWYGDKKVYVKGLDDFPGYAKHPHDDKALAAFIGELYQQADIVIAHNGDQFDQKVVNARLITNKVQPPERYYQIDTKKSAKRVARFASNKLDDLGRQLGLGQKLSHGSFEELWLGCDKGDAKAWKTMKAYNKQDVHLLEQFYLEIRPWIPNHPPLNVMSHSPGNCVRCCGNNIIPGAKYRATNTNLYRYFRCADCGGTMKSRIPEPRDKEERMVYTNG